MSKSSSTAASPKSHGGHSIWPDVSLIGVALIWGINIPVMKIGLEQLNVFGFNAIRLTISLVVLAACALRERRLGTLPKPGITFRHVLLYAIIVTVLYQILFLLGVARTTSGNVALIIATVPMWTALFARIFIGEELRKLAWCGLAIALAGTIVVALQKGDVTAGTQHLLGNLLILCSALLWSAGTVYSRPLLMKISPLQLSAAAAAIGLPVHIAIAIFAASQNQIDPQALRSVGLWMIILYSGTLSSGLSQPMWHFGVRHAGAAHAAIVQNLIPLVAIVTAWLVRDEAASAAQIFGGIMILSGLILMRMAR